MLDRLKTIKSYTGLSRWLSELSEDPIGYLATCQLPEIKSPYAYSPTRAIYDWDGRPVIWSEVSHRRYEVYEVPANLLRFKTHDAATDWHVRFCERRA